VPMSLLEKPRLGKIGFSRRKALQVACGCCEAGLAAPARWRYRK
jgi:hypothetical protein